MFIAPIPMKPAYRFGAATPWGGKGLSSFGKDIPDKRTGEALECSAIPGLNSTDDRGTPLSALIGQLGDGLVGTSVRGEFPLLLKLLNAKDRLSVQVHPGNKYAKLHENKLGKTEAWYILHAEPGASIIYGVKEGVTRKQLKEASMQGAAIEELLRFVPVHEGETYYIPSGMVHAIGKGITLYEIQQSSDVTYRFYDWERVDKAGNKRQLHLEDAIAVTDLSNQGTAAVPEEISEGRFQLLKNEYFTLEHWVQKKTILLPDFRRFGILTALKDTLLKWAEGEMELMKGQTVLLPARSFELEISTKELLLSYPTVE
ncbi:MAG: mannose-6-phosphate isomerase [Clostridiales bacterium]|nr:mannose-6-phosphate isomerase [Clostridiales bacterium]